MNVSQTKILVFIIIFNVVLYNLVYFLLLKKKKIYFFKLDSPKKNQNKSPLKVENKLPLGKMGIKKMIK